MPTDIKLDHFQPKRPVVRPTIPFAQGVADPPAPELARELAVLVDELVAGPGRQDDALPLQVVKMKLTSSTLARNSSGMSGRSRAVSAGST